MVVGSNLTGDIGASVRLNGSDRRTKSGRYTWFGSSVCPTMLTSGLLWKTGALDGFDGEPGAADAGSAESNNPASKTNAVGSDLCDPSTDSPTPGFWVAGETKVADVGVAGLRCLVRGRPLLPLAIA